MAVYTKGKIREILPALHESQYQPAGVDLTLEKVFEFTSPGVVDFDNTERKVSDVKELSFDDNGYVHLSPGVYKIRFTEVVSIPEDAIALGLPRSTLLRCGAMIEASVWDPGYKGKSECLLIVHNPHGIKLKHGARVLQMFFIKTENEKGGKKEVYSGTYQNENLNK